MLRSSNYSLIELLVIQVTCAPDGTPNPIAVLPNLPETP